MPSKKERLLASLDKGMTMIHLDARRPGVLVPEHLKGEPHLLLNISYRFDPPDLSVGEWGIRSTLTFAGDRFTVAIPWSALYAISSHVSKEFWVFPEDMPAELLEKVKVTSKVPVSAPARRGRGGPTLRAVAREELADESLELTSPEPTLASEAVVAAPAEPEQPLEEEKPELARPAARAHLRLVK